MQRTLEPEVMDTAEEAEAYASMDHREANRAFVDRLFELGAHGSMLDIGTGPGQILLAICERDPKATVLGVDLAERMLRVARRLRDASRHAHRIELRRADAKALDLAAGGFDTVLSNTILHHIPDPVPFLREAFRVLRPGGVLLIRDLLRPDSPEAANALVTQHASDATPEQRELFRASLHASLTQDELRSAARAAGLWRFEITQDSDRHVSIQIAAAGDL